MNEITPKLERFIHFLTKRWTQLTAPNKYLVGSRQNIRLFAVSLRSCRRTILVNWVVSTKHI